MTSDELTYRRVHHAPRELLFDCMTQPRHLAAFWGPAGTTTPRERIVADLRPGGVFQTVMVNDADGSEYTMRAVYDVVDRPALLAWTEEGSGMSVTIRFTDLGDGRTEVVTRQVNVPEAYRSPQAQAGFVTSLDRCDRYVASLMAARSGRDSALLATGGILMEKTRSADGTEIAFDRIGDGPPVVLVSGASCARGIHSQLAALLAAGSTVLNYDRRGRGDSGDTQPYAVEREIDDLAAVIAAAGGEAAVAGNSSGAVLALRAAAHGLPVTRLALWEPPVMTDPDAPARQREYVARLTALLGEGRRGDAMALFMTTVGLPPDMITAMRGAPVWPGLEAIAPTLAYDAAVMGDSTLPADAPSVKIPVLVLTGSASGPWAPNAARALTGTLPDAEHRVLDGQDHNVAWDVLAPALRPFLCPARPVM